MSISIVIPTWNYSDLLMECLASLDKQTRPADEIIVVDDGSTYDVTDTVSRDFPHIRVLRRDFNGGFARAANTGLQAAKGEWILLLNNDMTLAPDFLEHMFAATTGEAKLLAALVLWKDDPDTIYSAGDQLHVNGRPEAIGFREPLEGFTMPESIFGVSGGAALIHRSVFETVGYLDESFVAYFEDVDLCMRARLAGFQATLVPEARAWHVGSASIADRTWWRSAQCYRNHNLLLIKNYPIALLPKYLFAIKREQWHQARQCFSACRCEFGAIKALAITLKTFGSICIASFPALVKRKHIQRQRTMAIKDFERLLTGARK